VLSVLVAKRINSTIKMKEGRDQWLQPLLDQASDNNVAEIMDAEDPLFILYTSGSTGKPKGMVHTTAGYMVYSAYTFKNVLIMKTMIFFGVPLILVGLPDILIRTVIEWSYDGNFRRRSSYPDFSRFWQTIESIKSLSLHAPTAIRALAKHRIRVLPIDFFESDWISGRTINEEAWHWYNNHVGDKKCPVVDTWWQTETGGIMISPIAFVTPTKPTYASLPLPEFNPF
jgi:acetyl-CoA synthetase